MGGTRNHLADILEIDQMHDAKGFSGVSDFIKNKYAIDHVVYVSTKVKGHSASNPYIDTTYSPEWYQRYIEQNYAAIDPVMDYAFSSGLPVDWRTVCRQDRTVSQFFGEATEYNVGNHGITLPIRTSGAGVAGLFTLSVSASDREWESQRRGLYKEIYTVGQYFHARVMERYRTSGDDVSLTKRERESIAWASEGKTIDDIATIMGISRETVNAHLDQVRRKSNALNTAHAISLLYRQGLLG